MDIKIIIQLFIIGLTTSSIFCLLTCSPLFYFIYTLKEKTLKNLIIKIVKFNISKFITHLIVIFILYFAFGKFFSKYISNYTNELSILFGIIFVLIAFLFSKPKTNFILNPNFFGIISGLNFCLPKIFVFSFIFFKSKNIFEIFFYLSAFSLGESLSPIILVFLFLEKIKENLVKRNKEIKTYINRLVQILFLLVGLYNIYIGLRKVFLLK